MASFPAAQAGGGDKMKWTLHTHFEVDCSVPTRIDVTPTAGGEHDERAVMARAVEGQRLSLDGVIPNEKRRPSTMEGKQ